MADAKDKKAAPKAAAKAKAPAKPKAETHAEAKAEVKAEPKAEAKKAAAAAKASAAPAGPTCSVAKCKRQVRAKGLCRKHYMGWRRGEVGKHHRYKTCTKEGCRKPRVKGSFCAEHSGKAAAADAAPAAAPAAAPPA